MPVESFVYFIDTEDGRYVKIGLTRRLTVRLSTIQIGHPGRLTVRGCLVGDRAKERQLHQEFATSHVRGEWFKRTPELDLAIEALGITKVLPPQSNTTTVGRGRPPVLRACLKCGVILGAREMLGHMGPRDTPCPQSQTIYETGGLKR